MIKVQCSRLESYRQNPKLYAELLAKRELKGGGSFGMLGNFKQKALMVHANELTVANGLKELASSFIQYDDNHKNRQRQEVLLDAFTPYCNEFNKRRLHLLYGRKDIKWDLHESVRLTGHSPLIAQKKDEIYSFIVVEKPLPGWRDELRFPLIQQYIAAHIVLCDADKVNVGVYTISEKSFDFECYKFAGRQKAIKETKDLFETVYDTYQKFATI